MKVIGIQKNVAFNMDGRDIRGLNLFCSEKRTSVEGEATEKIFINESREVFVTALTLAVGDSFTPIYDRFGKVAGIIPDKKSN